MTQEQHMRRIYTEECKRDAVVLGTGHRLPGNGSVPPDKGGFRGVEGA